MEIQLPPTVNINGDAIRQIREEKRLTQLYVAKVTGVTTDTISRWENNRYPSIKRENVLRLAEALEVSVDQILMVEQEEQEELPSLEDTPVKARSPYRMLPLLLLGVVLAATFLIYISKDPPAAKIVARRTLPAYAAPGSVIPVWIEFDRSLAGKGYILRERFPSGWKLIEANPPPSSLDNVEGVARWIVKPGEKRLKVAYMMKVGKEDALGKIRQFSGEVVAKNNDQGRPELVGGSLDIILAPYIWADSNGDSRVDDNEMLQASDVVDNLQGVHIDWSTLEKIWDAGGYQWQPAKARFLPMHDDHSGDKAK